MTDSLLVSTQDAVATLTFNRPSVMNAMDLDMTARLKKTTESLCDDTSIRAVVLRGAGNAFMAGGDVALFHTHLQDLPQLIVAMAREFHYVIMALRRMAKPVLASAHGSVAGAGVSLLAAADLAIAAEGTKFTLAYSNIGTSPDGGSTYFLPRLLGSRKAMEMALLPDAFDAQSALSAGLINRVVPQDELEAYTQKIAQRLANGPTIAFARTKALFNQSFAATLESQLEAEAQAFAFCARSADLREGIAAFVEKRKPRFSGA
jgi:2-(1,2-epoxy-1,2-dihydrophenyl)acetyl-CoA isomerase